MAGVGQRTLQARELMAPLQAAKLRACGWQMPAALPGDYTLHVYDTRLDVAWLGRLLPELGLAAGAPHIIGGDFLQSPYREDAVALHEAREGSLPRWGPAGSAPYHLVVPPRPHVAAWLARARKQLDVESKGTWVSVAFVVPRAKCPQTWSTPSITQVLPQVEALLKDPF